MYNGYNYYPTNGSTSPVYLMPYPYQYDPFFMAPTPSTDVSASDNAEDSEQPENQQNGDAESAGGNEEKVESNDAKENNQIAEGEQNVSDYLFSDGVGAKILSVASIPSGT